MLPPDDKGRLPLTRDDLSAQFAALGVAAGHIVVMHSAMSKIKDWVIGGAETVIRAMMDVLGENGTLVMPTQTSDNSDPAYWRNPPVPEAWWQPIRDHLPAYDPQITPTRYMGVIPELFRTFPGVKRSGHPITSFAVWGRYADEIVAEQPLDAEFGEQSPLAKVYALDGWVLLLGVDHNNNTSLHLAEHRADWGEKPLQKQGSALLVNGVRQWVEYTTLDYNADDFSQIGAAYEAEIGYTPGKIGQADAHYLRQRPLVDYAVKWMAENRGGKP